MYEYKIQFVSFMLPLQTIALQLITKYYKVFYGRAVDVPAISTWKNCRLTGIDDIIDRWKILQCQNITCISARIDFWQLTNNWFPRESATCGVFVCVCVVAIIPHSMKQTWTVHLIQMTNHSRTSEDSWFLRHLYENVHLAAPHLTSLRYKAHS